MRTFLAANAMLITAVGLFVYATVFSNTPQGGGCHISFDPRTGEEYMSAACTPDTEHRPSPW